MELALEDDAMGVAATQTTEVNVNIWVQYQQTK